MLGNLIKVLAGGGEGNQVRIVRLAKPAEDVIEWLTGYDPRVTESQKGFTLIELLVICAILATMVTIGVGSISSGQGAARIKGATRDVFAAIRHARSVALVTGQPAIITYSTAEEDGEVMAKIEVTSAKLFSSEEGKPYETLSGWPIEGEENGHDLVHFRGSNAKSFAKGDEAKDSGEGADLMGEGGGETVEEILFKPMDAEVVKGMRLKVLKDEDDPHASGSVGRKPRVSVFSNVDYLIGRFKDAKAEAKKKSDEDAKKDDPAAFGASELDAAQEPVSVVWETNGRVDPHRVWVYADGQKPEDGLLIRIDRFGAAKVLSGDGREDD